MLEKYIKENLYTPLYKQKNISVIEDIEIFKIKKIFLEIFKYSERKAILKNTKFKFDVIKFLFTRRYQNLEDIKHEFKNEFNQEILKNLIDYGYVYYDDIDEEYDYWWANTAVYRFNSIKKFYKIIKDKKEIKYAKNNMFRYMSLSDIFSRLVQLFYIGSNMGRTWKIYIPDKELHINVHSEFCIVNNYGVKIYNEVFK